MTFRFRVLPPRPWPEGGISVGRPRRWSNPYKVKPHGPYERHEAIRLFREDLFAGRLTDPKTREVLTVEKAIAELRGRPLACFCKLDEACHADVLLALANAPACEEPRP
jgi:hypothetical protein